MLSESEQTDLEPDVGELNLVRPIEPAADPSIIALGSALRSTTEDPSAWDVVCDRLAELVGGVGASLHALPFASPPAIVPASASISEYLSALVSEKWYDVSPLRRAPPSVLARRNYFTDADIVPESARTKDPYYAHFLPRFGLQWVLGFSFKIGERTWCATIQGAAWRGPFGPEDASRLLEVRRQLEIAAVHAALLGSARVRRWENVLDQSGRLVIAIDSAGKIRDMSDAADALLSAGLAVLHGRVVAQDATVDDKLQRLIRAGVMNGLGVPMPMPPPIALRCRNGSDWILDAAHLPKDFPSLANDVVLLLFARIAHRPSPADVLASRFRLTRREAELSVLLADGKSLKDAADALAITVGTARSHLHSAFQKTETSRQSELVLEVARAVD